MKKNLLIVIFIAAAVFWVLQQSEASVSRFHSEQEYRSFRSYQRSYVYQTNPIFPGAGLCVSCHAKDDNQVASVDANGHDINIMDDWAATMMANSSRDPFWRAKVSHEILMIPGEQADIEQACTSCHAPMGNFNAAHHGLPYTVAALSTDSLGLDGVSCGACHQIRDTTMGITFSGELYYDTTHRIYGPYFNPFPPPMVSNIGYIPAYGAQINASALCGKCHTLQTQTHDLSGNITGNIFTEQATYHEWLNSIFNTDINPNGISCQGCHLPRTNDEVTLSKTAPILPGRSPFGKHHLAGGNSFMLKLMQANIATLNLYASTTQFDSTIARTERLLQTETLQLSLLETGRTMDSVFYTVTLLNKAGHKFPSGYPSRRAYIEFVLLDDHADTIFRSGILDAGGHLINQNNTYEPHYDLINSEQQVQIYEMVMGDVNNNVTTVLQYAKLPLKDNRIPPEGFSTTHSAYDTCMIAGTALNDVDFNKYLSTEGTGGDIVHYHIPLNGYSGNLNVSAKVYYQSVPLKWLEDMFTFSSPEIDLFKSLFNAADQTPVLIAKQTDGTLFQSVTSVTENHLRIFPNPVSGDFFIIQSNSNEPLQQVDVYDLSGKLISSLKANGNTFITPKTNGTYLLRIKQNNSWSVHRLVVNH